MDTHREQRGQGMIELLVAIGVIATCIVAIVGLILYTITVSNISKTQITGVNLAREGIEIVRNVRDSNWLALDSGVAGAAWDAGMYGGSVGSYIYTAVAELPIIPEHTYTSEKIQLEFTPQSTPNSTAINFSIPATQMYWQVAAYAYLGAKPDYSAFADAPLNLLVQSTSIIHPTNCATDHHDSYCPPTSSASPFYRMLTLHPICWSGSDATSEKVVTGDGPDCSVFNANSAVYTKVGVEVRSEVRWLVGGKIQKTSLVEKLYNWKQ